MNGSPYELDLSKELPSVEACLESVVQHVERYASSGSGYDMMLADAILSRAASISCSGLDFETSRRLNVLRKTLFSDPGSVLPEIAKIRADLLSNG